MTDETPDSVDLFVINAIKTFNAAELDGVIQSLGFHREQMTPALSTPTPLAEAIHPVRAPQWHVQTVWSDEDHLVLHIRDPRFGWLHYVYPLPEARKLGEKLAQSANEPKP